MCTTRPIPGLLLYNIHQKVSLTMKAMKTPAGMPRTLVMIAKANSQAVTRSGGWLEISKAGALCAVSPAKRARPLVPAPRTT